MAVQPGLCRTWSGNPEDRFSHDAAQFVFVEVLRLISLYFLIIIFAGDVESATHYLSFKCKTKHNSPAENHFDLEVRSKVFFFTDSCSADLAFEESK